jgi:hypothetical protein
MNTRMLARVAAQTSQTTIAGAGQACRSGARTGASFVAAAVIEVLARTPAGVRPFS